MRNKVLIIILTSLILLAFGALYFGCCFDNYLVGTLFFDIVMTATAVFGVFGLIFQSTRAKDLEEAQFIVSINQEFINNDNYQLLLNSLEANKKLDTDLLNIAAQYLDFFEPLYVLIKKKMIKIDMIDDLFCYRFFAVVNNKTIQEKVLTPYKDYYRNICNLHYVWKKYRRDKTRRKVIPLMETDLARMKWYHTLLDI